MFSNKRSWISGKREARIVNRALEAPASVTPVQDTSKLLFTHAGAEYCNIPEPCNPEQPFPTPTKKIPFDCFDVEK